MSTTVIVVIVLVLLAAAALGFVASRRRRSTQLQQQFGPEYERQVSAADGDRKAAEATLTERQQRRQEFDVRDLRPEERTRFRESWNDVQRDFVDDPRRSLHAADRLVGDVMRTRGYPVDDDFERRADDLSVDHPRVVQHYREARRVRDAGDTDTENQRTALTSYRSLVDALLGDDDHGDRDGHDRDPRDHDHDHDVRDHDPRDDRRDHDRDDRVAGSSAGRHALRDPHDDGPADPDGPQGRSEERIR